MKSTQLNEALSSYFDSMQGKIEPELEESQESKVLKDLIAFDYSNLNFKKVIEFKLKVIALQKELDEFVNKRTKGFDEVTNGAYGYMHNPYKKVRDVAKASLKRCDYILGILKEEDIYQLIDLPKNMKMSVRVLFGDDFTFHFGSSDNKDVIFTKGLLALQKQMNLYKEAENNKQDIFRRYLGFEEGVVGTTHYIIEEYNGDDFKFMAIRPGEEYLVYDSYGINKYDWISWSSYGSIDLNSKDFRKLNKIYFPEHFV